MLRGAETFNVHQAGEVVAGAGGHWYCTYNSVMTCTPRLAPNGRGRREKGGIKVQNTLSKLGYANN
jgi:hypothetical protein